VRDNPCLVHGIPVEPSANLVMESAPRHGIKRPADSTSYCRVPAYGKSPSRNSRAPGMGI
jgi:hypothetical protein